jgi:hypothetical protein
VEHCAGKFAGRVVIGGEHGRDFWDGDDGGDVELFGWSEGRGREYRDGAVEHHDYRGIHGDDYDDTAADGVAGD